MLAQQLAMPDYGARTAAHEKHRPPVQLQLAKAQQLAVAQSTVLEAQHTAAVAQWHEVCPGVVACIQALSARLIPNGRRLPICMALRQ